MSNDGMGESEAAQGLRRFFLRILTYKVHEWGSQTDRYDLGLMDPSTLEHSDVASSLRTDGNHTVVIDIDHDAWLVKSSTEGHYHLYIDVPGGIKPDTYFDMLDAMAEAGVVEKGYADVSRKRGHSDVRLPWKKKPKKTRQAPITWDVLGDTTGHVSGPGVAQQAMLSQPAAPMTEATKARRDEFIKRFTNG